MCFWKEQRKSLVGVATGAWSCSSGRAFFMVKVAQRHLRDSCLFPLWGQELE